MFILSWCVSKAGKRVLWYKSWNIGNAYNSKIEESPKSNCWDLGAYQWDIWSIYLWVLPSYKYPWIRGWKILVWLDVELEASQAFQTYVNFNWRTQMVRSIVVPCQNSSFVIFSFPRATSSKCREVLRSAYTMSVWRCLIMDFRAVIRYLSKEIMKGNVLETDLTWSLRSSKISQQTRGTNTCNSSCEKYCFWSIAQKTL